MRACFYYPIRIAESEPGRKGDRKAVVETNMRTLGTVVDLSAGGCAIQSLNPADKGKLVMIEFDIDRQAPVRTFGKVILPASARLLASFWKHVSARRIHAWRVISAVAPTAQRRTGRAVQSHPPECAENAKMRLWALKSARPPR